MHFYRFSLLLLFLTSVIYSQDKKLKNHILFYNSFDGSTIADIAVGDSLIYTAENYEKTENAKPGLHNDNVVLATNKGLVGDALYFIKKNTAAIFFNGYKNLGYSSESWSGSFSFWLQLDPSKDLEPGYCDPINLTDVRYDDAALWVDFTKDNPRHFRLGVMGDLEVRKNEESSNMLKKRTVSVKKTPFKRGEWTHVVITYSQINTNKTVCKLYLNGQLQGAVKGVNDPFTWNEENAKIMLGLSYVGFMDELASFDKPLSDAEVKFVYGLKNGLHSLIE